MLTDVRLRIVTLLAVIVAAVAGVVIYVLHAHDQQDAARAAAPTAAQTSLSAVLSGSRIVFRNSTLGSGYGAVAMVALSDPSGPRAMTHTSCDRVYATPKDYLCLASTLGVVTTYSAHVLNDSFVPVQALPLTGIPSRARLSADGTLAATTSFVSGDSYANTSFSTRTVISRVGGASLGSLEEFSLFHNGVKTTPTDRNFWGVTFAADDNTFYVTAAWGGHTWLSKGSISARTIVTLHEDAECPSLSPDGKTIVYKQRGGRPAGQWRLMSYVVATGATRLLSETHTVDDQVEWLDNSTVLYGIPGVGSQAGVANVWTARADGTGQPILLIKGASSPAVVRG